MISKIAGIISKKDTKTKQWWLKLGIALILSNIFFFLLFSGNEVQSPEQEPSLPAGWVEIQLKAELMTPFHEGKKINWRDGLIAAWTLVKYRFNE